MDFNDYYVKIYEKKSRSPLKIKKIRGRIMHQSKDGSYKICDNTKKHNFIKKIYQSDICEKYDEQTFISDETKQFVVVIVGRSDYETLNDDEKKGILFGYRQKFESVDTPSSTPYYAVINPRKPHDIFPVSLPWKNVYE
jgi:hypothetical protein